MATGDTNNMLARLKAVLPARWFPDTSPILDALLSGFASAASWVYGLIQYAKLQTRIATATDGFLDLAAYDFFGRRIKRRKSQTDISFRRTIQDEVLRERVTRPGVQKAVADLTDNKVTIFEAFNPHDTGGWGVMFAFNMAGAWGSNTLPYTMFITAVQPQGAGIPNISGFNSPQSGWGAGMFYLADLSGVTGEVTNQDIYDTVEASRAAGVTCWVNIAPPPRNASRLGVDFILGSSVLGSP
ncbi:hypothetical protein [Labrys neptuniae]|uniref:DUF2612 domain-containing protein n=1 Tax=Labrys neptuniae TaxID=376174 RepID=A0ABV3PG07_9HYPH